MRLAATPPDLPLRHPACLLATWFGSGLLPRMPGTWGSAAALPFGVAILYGTGRPGLLVATVAVFLLGWWAAEIYVRHAGIDDPGVVVIDEVAGQWLTLLAASPLDPLHVFLAFVLFRAFDIVKPWPVSWAERRFARGLGIMLDDIVAGLYAFAVLYIILELQGFMFVS